MRLRHPWRAVSRDDPGANLSGTWRSVWRSRWQPQCAQDAATNLTRFQDSQGRDVQSPGRAVIRLARCGMSTRSRGCRSSRDIRNRYLGRKEPQLSQITPISTCHADFAVFRRPPGFWDFRDSAAGRSPPACPEGVVSSRIAAGLENLCHLWDLWFQLLLTRSQRDPNPARAL